MRPRRLIIVYLALLLTSCSQTQSATQVPVSDKSLPEGQVATWNFDTTTDLPDGISLFSGDWQIQQEPDAPSAPNALCQVGNATHPALALSGSIYEDVVVSVNFKPISGNQDQAAGILVRIQNKDNFYIVRANALENNVNIYKYVGAVRSVIKEGQATVKAGEWQILRVEITGNQIQGYLNDQLVVEATDTTYAAGSIGLWTKADSFTCFDDVQATAK